MSFDNHISSLRQEATGGGDPEIIALSAIFNCLFEVYKETEIPNIRRFPNLIGNTNPTVRLFFRRSHYSLIRSDGVGNQLFDFEGLQEGELERQMAILSESKKHNKLEDSHKNSFHGHNNIAHAIQLSLNENEAENNYKRFYASRIIKKT